MADTNSGELRRVIFVSAGASHSAALLSGGVVCSFGRGEDGQLGHGDADERHHPTIIYALNDSAISSITCGADHTTAYSAKDLTVYSWGWGDFGRLGHGNSSDLFLPHPIKALQGLEILQIACGDSHCLAVTVGDEVYSWGRNQNGQLGLGNTEDALVPQKVIAFEGKVVKMLAAGAEHTAAVTKSGKLYGWGWGRYGNLGLGDRNDRLIPGEVPSVPGEHMSMVACGWRHTIAVAESGKLYTYGWSKYGQLGHGDYADHLIPHQVQALKEHRIVQISGGWRHTFAVDDQGDLYGWGWNKFGQVGVGNKDDHNIPQLLTLSEGQKVVQVACGWRHTVAITDVGNVFSWGRGTNGQLGHGDAIDSYVFFGMPTSRACFNHTSSRQACALVANEKGMIKFNCQSGQSRLLTASILPTDSTNWISPSERYAVVPDETLGPLTGRLHRTASVTPPGEQLGGNVGNDASVPDTDIKRIRTA